MERESFAERLLSGARTPKDADEVRSAVVAERQPTAQAPSLTAIFKDGRKKRGFAWAHYSDYEWTEEAAGEKLVVLFGNRMLTIEGEVLDDIAQLVETNRLSQVRELTHREVENLRHDNPERKPIVTRLSVAPEISDMAAAIRGDEEEARYPRRVK